jgi:hypothetical protein
MEGRGCEVSVPRGLEVLRRAVELKQPGAMFQLAMCHFNGIGTAKDAAKVRRRTCDSPSALLNKLHRFVCLRFILISFASLI